MVSEPKINMEQLDWILYPLFWGVSPMLPIGSARRVGNVGGCGISDPLIGVCRSLSASGNTVRRKVNYLALPSDGHIKALLWVKGKHDGEDLMTWHSCPVGVVESARVTPF